MQRKLLALAVVVSATIGALIATPPPGSGRQGQSGRWPPLSQNAFTTRSSFP